MRTIAIALTAATTMLLGAGSAQAGVVASANGVISYVANQGESNDVVVSTSTLLGLSTYTIRDADANPITTTTPDRCSSAGSFAMCRQDGVSSFIIDVRDRDDTALIGTGEGGAPPVGIGALMIGGRGNDTLRGGNGGDILKGNDNRDSLRGKGGRDTYKGGRGRDNLQTLDGISDTFISCGDGRGDVVRKDRIDPKAHHCEFSNRGNPSKPH
jgi:Ca2+-binding RTX toxin-like protein